MNAKPVGAPVRRAWAAAWKPGLSVIVLLGIWQLVVTYGSVSPSVVPTPSSVLSAIGANVPSLVSNCETTLCEAGLGLLIGNVLAIACSVLFLYFKRFEDLAYPILLAVQAIPLIAIAPIFTLWLGFGVTPKAILAAFLTYPLTLVSLTKGYESCPVEVLDLMRSLKATKLQQIRMALVPSAIPMFMTSLKLGAATAVVGAIATEYVGSIQGLGFLLQHTQAQLQVPLMWGVCIVVIVLGSVLYAAFSWLEHLIPIETTTNAQGSLTAA